jgi:hypothetical protein
MAESSNDDVGTLSPQPPLHHHSFSSNNPTVDTILPKKENFHSKRRNYTGLGRMRFGRAYPCIVALSVLIYWTFVSLVPVYNKFFFQNTQYPYPVATAGIQLAVVSLLLAILNTIQHFCFKRQNQRRYDRYHSHFSCEQEDDDDDDETYRDSPSTTFSSSSSSSVDDSSWIFGPHFWWKFKWCFPIGALFGLKYAFTNLGLHLVSAPTHLLLQSTDLVWTVVSSWWINGEAVSKVEIFCLGGCVAGSIVLGWQLQESSISAPFYAITINLISPILLGLCLATLRLACTELMRPDNYVKGSVSAVELTSIKLVVSSVVGLMMACIMEGGDESRDPWWIAFVELSKSTRWGVIGGALLISVFQVNCTFLTFLTSAVSLGLVGQVKIIPQWLLAAFSSSRNSNFQFHWMNMLGALLIMGSAAAFALSNWIKSTPTPAPSSGKRYHDVRSYNTDEARDSVAKDTEAGDCSNEERTFLLLSHANDFRAAFVRNNYCTIDKALGSGDCTKSKVELSEK